MQSCARLLVFYKQSRFNTEAIFSSSFHTAKSDTYRIKYFSIYSLFRIGDLVLQNLNKSQTNTWQYQSCVVISVKIISNKTNTVHKIQIC